MNMNPRQKFLNYVKNGGSEPFVSLQITPVAYPLTADKVREDLSIYCVEDNGIGLAPEHLEKIFEIFYRIAPNRSPGEGLGLTIVRRIIDRHGGKIRVESEVGKGSKFFISLPNRMPSDLG